MTDVYTTKHRLNYYETTTNNYKQANVVFTSNSNLYSQIRICINKTQSETII